MKLPISKLRNNTGQVDGVPANPRTISTDDYQKLIDSIKDDPEYLEHEMPHVIKHGDVYVVLNGNQRLRALKELGYKEVPVTIYPDDTPPDVIKARIIKSNHGYGKDDMDMLANEWSDMPLDEWGIDLPDDWLEQEPEVEEDEAPEVDESEPPKSKLGEVYQLGRHRVMCGDSTSEDDASTLMNGSLASMVFTDPPYGVDYDGGHAVKGKRRDKLENDGDAEIYNNVLPNLVKFTEDKAAFYIWYSDSKSLAVLSAVLSAGLEIRTNIIWNKNVAQFGAIGAQYKTKHEPVLYLYKKGKSPYWYGPNNEVSVWDVSRDHKNDHHPTQKPVELPVRAMKNNSKKGDVILDLFLGSGSTLIACEQTDRTCYGMEISESYTDVVRKRWAKYVYPDRWEKEWEILTPAADDQLPENWEELTPAI